MYAARHGTEFAAPRRGGAGVLDLVTEPFGYKKGSQGPPPDRVQRIPHPTQKRPRKRNPKKEPKWLPPGSPKGAQNELGSLPKALREALLKGTPKRRRKTAPRGGIWSHFGSILGASLKSSEQPFRSTGIVRKPYYFLHLRHIQHLQLGAENALFWLSFRCWLL